MTRKHPDAELRSVLVRDPAWTDPDDMFGIGLEPSPRRNPSPSSAHKAWKRAKPQTPAAAARVLKAHGIVLSSNPKTILCFSAWFDTCQRTAWCRKYCYGASVNFQQPDSRNKFQHNSAALRQLARAPQADVDEVADAIKAVCRHYDTDNVRWSGIGDLVPGAIRVIDAMTANDPGFTVWGFTRKGGELLNCPVRDNIVFWCSTDDTMSNRRIEIQAEAALRHQTALAYATVTGSAYHRDGPDPNPPRTAAEEQHHLREDPFLARLLQRTDVDVSVVFGYHGNALRYKGPITTHVGVRAIDADEFEEHDGLNECPGTDPLGGGHVYGVCQQCYWCIEKPHDRPYASLREARLNRVVVDDNGREVSLNGVWE